MSLSVHCWQDVCYLCIVHYALVYRTINNWLTLLIEPQSFSHALDNTFHHRLYWYPSRLFSVFVCFFSLVVCFSDVCSRYTIHVSFLSIHQWFSTFSFKRNLCSYFDCLQNQWAWRGMCLEVTPEA